MKFQTGFFQRISKKDLFKGLYGVIRGVFKGSPWGLKWDFNGDFKANLFNYIELDTEVKGTYNV